MVKICPDNRSPYPSRTFQDTTEDPFPSLALYKMPLVTSYLDLTACHIILCQLYILEVSNKIIKAEIHGLMN